MTHRRLSIKAWKKFKSGRNTGKKRTPKKRLLVICEGEKTEPNYFKSFRVTSATVVVRGIGIDTVKLVSVAIDLKEKAIRERIPFDQVWCVFDKDSFSVSDFKKAIALATEQRVEVVYSNEAFEVWYLLHFSYFHTGVPRREYTQKLTKCLGKEYQKNSKDMYEDLLNLQKNALKNAKKLLSSYTQHRPEFDNPCTTVFKLVEELNRNL